MSSGINSVRRTFLGGGRRGSSRLAVRPPWGLPEPRFSDLCTRCHDCIKACPEQIIKPDTNGVPAVDFHQGECTFCRQCVEACPEPLFLNPSRNVAWDHRARIGRACLGYQGIVCQSCKESCEVGAIRFLLWERRIPVPRIDSDTCTGCGACVGVCPVQAITMQTDHSPWRPRDE